MNLYILERIRMFLCCCDVVVYPRLSFLPFAPSLHQRCTGVERAGWQRRDQGGGGDDEGWR